MCYEHPRSMLCLPLLILLSAIPLSAHTPVRGASGNGENPDAATWSLLARSQSIALTKDGKRVTMRRQIVCLNQDVEDSLPSPNLLLTGTCDSGAYLHIFQFESESKDVVVRIGHFAANPDSLENYGVMVCDNNNRETGNTLELCTNVPMEMRIPDIKIAVGKTAVRFAVPDFPWYPTGIDNQGRGLTLYVIIQQSSPLPIQIPTVEIP
jgi:hypothetical protein